MKNTSGLRRGAPKGNQNGRKAKLWTQAITNALKKRSASERMEELEAIANKLIDAAKDGHLPSIQEIGNRLEGKVAQSLEIDDKRDNEVDFSDGELADIARGGSARTSEEEDGKSSIH